ncbi:MAG: chromosomal replication initiator protein DnaA [Alphaproteobacteria bacterium]|nr:chromosomal replication initiator protein DnaA [Alphaproteobacteria bacterium]
MNEITPAQWERVRERLRAEFGEATFNTWLKGLAYVGTQGGRVTLGAGTRYAREYVMANYVDRLRAACREECPAIHQVEIVVQPRNAAPQPAAPGRGRDGAATIGNDGDIGSPLDPRYTFENFVVGPPNEFAHAAARRVAEADAAPYNPLFIYGGVGLGKSHLMHAIGWHIRRRQPDRKIVYLSSEHFFYRFVGALRSKDTMAFKQQFRAVDILMVDDVQFLIGKESTQDEFYNTFNALADLNKQMIFTADKSPADMDKLDDRLRSRLGWGLVADIHPSDYELRLGILQTKAQQLGGTTVPERVLEFLAHRITTNVRELEGALNRLLAHHNLVGRPITPEMAQEVLRDLLRAADRKVNVEDIQKLVATHYNIRLNEMNSSRRARSIARPRQVAMWLCKQLTPRSLPEIGRKFSRDHTTVMHAVRKIDELRMTDRALAEDLELLRRQLEG